MLRQPKISIEADRRSPLVCVTFGTKFDVKQPAALETYLSNENVAKLAPRANDKQFCVEGFPNGQKDQLTVHAASHGANALLRKTQTISIDVPNRPHRLPFPVFRPDPSADSAANLLVR